MTEKSIGYMYNMKTELPKIAGVGIGKMAQWLKAPTAKPDNLNPIPKHAW